MEKEKVKFDGKVLIIVNDFGVGGAQRMVVDQLRELKSRNIKTKVLTLKSELPQTLKGELTIDEADWEFIDFGSLYNILSWWKVILFLVSYRPDKVFCNLWMSNTIGRICCRIIGIKDLVIFELNVYDNIKSKKIFFIDNLLQYWCKKIIACTPEVKDSLIRHGIKENRIEVIYNAFDITRFSIPKNELLKKQLGFSENSFIFLFIGRWVHQKAVDTLIKSFGEFKKNSGENAVLVLLGRGNEEENLHKITKDLNLENEVHFLGTRSDIPEILSICDCFVLVSRHEGFPIALLEAMASKKPIVITDFLGGKGIVENEVQGLVVPIDDINSISSALERVYTDNLLRNKIVQNAFEKVQEYGMSEYVNNILKI